MRAHGMKWLRQKWYNVSIQTKSLLLMGSMLAAAWVLVALVVQLHTFSGKSEIIMNEYMDITGFLNTFSTENVCLEAYIRPVQPLNAKEDYLAAIQSTDRQLEALRPDLQADRREEYVLKRAICNAMEHYRNSQGALLQAETSSEMIEPYLSLKTQAAYIDDYTRDLLHSQMIQGGAQWQEIDSAYAAQCSGRIDQQPGHRLFQGEFPNDAHILAVDGHGVPDAFVLQNLYAAGAGAFPAVLHIKCQDGAELFLGIRIVFPHRSLGRKQYPGPDGDGNARHFGDGLGRAAHDLGIHRAVGTHDEPAHLFAFLGAHEIATLLLHLSDHLVLDAALRDDALLRGADGPVVKGLAVKNMLDGHGDISGFFDIGRAVAGADTQGRIAGAIRRPHHSLAAGGQDDADMTKARDQ